MIIESEADLAAKVCVLTKQLGSPKVTSTEDYISAMSWSQCGKYFALGDHSGRLIIFGEHDGDLKYFTEVPAHKHSHDWQTNRQVAARINSLHWLQCHNNLQILTCNQKYIRIWRVCQLNQKELDTTKGFVPEVLHSDELYFRHTLKTELPDLHYGRILHTALSTNQETLITVDSDRFFRWNLERVDTAEVLFKRERPFVEEEVNDKFEKEWAAVEDVTSVKFHGTSDNMYAYSTKGGYVHYIDLRHTAKHKDSLVLKSQITGILKGMPNSNMLEMVSDFCFTGQYEVVTRNFLKLKVWDLRKSNKPQQQSYIYPPMLSKFGSFMTDYGRNYLCDISRMENVDRRLITNDFNNCFHLFNLEKRTNHRIQIGEYGKPITKEIKKRDNPPDDELQPEPRMECISYHPQGKKVAVSTRNCVYFFDTFNY